MPSKPVLAPVYVADTLAARYPAAAAALRRAVEAAGHAVHELANTRDVWVRDFMPVPIDTGQHILFRYFPTYLRASKWRATITDATVLCEQLGLAPTVSPLVVDGGNVVRVGRQAVMTDRVFSENPNVPEPQLRGLLTEQLGAENVVIVPAHPQDFTGHVDGMLHPVDDRTVLLCAYQRERPAFKQALEQALRQAGIQWTYLPYNPYRNQTFTDTCGEYANALRLKGAVLIPVYGQAEDELALRAYADAFPGYSILPVFFQEVAQDGGAIHCVTWGGN